MARSLRRNVRQGGLLAAAVTLSWMAGGRTQRNMAFVALRAQARPGVSEPSPTPLAASSWTQARQSGHTSAAAAATVAVVTVATRVVARRALGRREAAAAAAAATALASSTERARAATGGKYPVLAEDSIMAQKAHGTSPRPVQENLRWNVDRKKADQICSFNRDFAEYGGYWQTTNFIDDLRQLKSQSPETEPEVTFYDSVTGKALFVAPRGRTLRDFLQESYVHGWPSFRDQEVVWDNVRCVKGGECVSVDGTHLGHNIPDTTGNRYCINLVSVAGQPLTA